MSRGLGRLALGFVLAMGAMPPARAQDQSQTMSPAPGFLNRQVVRPATGAAPPVGTAAPREPAPQGVPLAPLTGPGSAASVAPAPPAPAIPAPESPVSSTPQTFAPPPPAGPQYPDSWQPRQGVDLVGLEKVTAHATAFGGRIGQPLKFGTLQVTVQACLVRPADQPADAAAFLDIQDSTGAVPPFHGWIWAEEPARNVYEHPLYDLRLISCRG